MALELLTPWVFWYSNLTKEEKGQYQLTELIELNTLADFFNTVCYLKKVTDLEIGENISLFRKGKKPLWESCPTGGCWIIRVSRKDSQKVQKFWETLTIESIRGGFTEDIAGIMAGGKKFEIVIQVWMYEAAAAHKQVAVDLKKILGLSRLEMYLKYHKDSIQDMSSFKNSKKMSC